MLTRTEPLRVVVLSSHRSPGVIELLDDPEHGTLYEITALICSEERIAEEAELESRDVPVVHHPLRPYLEERGYNPFDLRHRHVYDQQLATMLEILEPDLIILSGYLYQITPTVLDRWAGRIINVHDSDLTILGDDGLPRYKGLRSTRQAIFAGEPETRATVHLVTSDLDCGPVLFRSEAFAVSPLAEEALAWGDETILKAYAHAHRAWVMRSAWGPLLHRAIELWASFEILIINGRVFVDGCETPLPDVECLGARTRKPALSLVSA